MVWDRGAVVQRSEFEPLAEASRRIYKADRASDVVSRPRAVGGLIEIPVSLPGDLELLEQGLAAEEIAELWSEIFRVTYRDGELFAPLLHPEAFDECRGAIDRLLMEAARLQPPVWVAQLGEICDWWKRRAEFGVQTSGRVGERVIQFDIDPDATVLVRDIEGAAVTTEWSERWAVLDSREISFEDGQAPFIGIDPDVSNSTRAVLAEEGFILQSGAERHSCGVQLSGAQTRSLNSERELLNYIDGLKGPLVRFGRWPNGSRSYLFIASDLDALSLVDYAKRFAIF